MGRVAKQVIIFDDETGEIIRDSVNRGTQNGDGWVIVYRDTYALLNKIAPPSALRIFNELMTKQEYEGGIKTTKKAVANALDISEPQSWRAFKWLKERGYLKERKINGQTEFLLNPHVTTCGKNRDDKIVLWESID
ncbi:MAG: hypothetical protein IJ563_09330 [Selenomonadaceae bacterium]|nr:hypothetical protein [Selenomonadaceae bacterium]MBR1858566.1 hypothetical protein [Selenomonadaceae bacterium]